MKRVRISNDSSMMAIQASYYQWSFQQYQVVDNCSDYNATFNSYSNLFCDCVQYQIDNKCSPLGGDSSTTNN